MPDYIVAGTHVEWTRTVAGYSPVEGWAATLHLAGPDVITPLAGTAAGEAFRFTLTDTITGRLRPGTYRWEERAAKAGKSYRMASGTVLVLPNLSQALAGTVQSHEERVLAALEVQIERRVGEDMSQYTIAQRQAVREDLQRLTVLRGQMLAAVRAQRSPGRFGTEVRGVFPPY